MLLKALTVNNELIKKAVFQLSEYDTVLDITYYDHNDNEILSEGYNILEKGIVGKLQEGLENEGIKVQYRLHLIIDTSK